MLNIYKKIEKSPNNMSGYIEVNAEELDRPFLLCISAQNTHDKSIYGLIREGASFARVHTTEENAAGFKINEMPIDFLGMRFQKDDKYQNNYEELVDKLLYPYLTSKGMDINTLMQKARMMNLLTYCDGTVTYKKAEELIGNRLRKDGVSEENIDLVLSQISLTAIETMVDTTSIKATSSTFVDVLDNEIYSERTETYQDTLKKYNRDYIYGTIGKNGTLFIYNGSGNHDLKEYSKEGSVVKTAISSVLTTYLENSINNSKQEELDKISIETPKEALSTYVKKSINPSESLKILDDKLSYNGALKYSEQELPLRNSLDESLKELFMLKKELEYTKADLSKKNKNLSDVIDGMKKYSSDETFIKIMSEANMWQVPKGLNVTEIKSDREIKKEYESLTNDNNRSL